MLSKQRKEISSHEGTAAVPSGTMTSVLLPFRKREPRIRIWPVLAVDSDPAFSLHGRSLHHG